jgi:hypothetical protein
LLLAANRLVVQENLTADYPDNSDQDEAPSPSYIVQGPISMAVLSLITYIGKLLVKPDQLMRRFDLMG